MKYIIAIISSIIFSIVSLKKNTPKICNNCKYYIHDNDTGMYSKCSLFPKKEDNYFLINGITPNNPQDYYYCSTTRYIDDMCGEKGKYFKKKIFKNKRIK